MPDRVQRLLLVDDEPQNLQVLRSILQANYELYYAKNGIKALEVAREHRPDLILLDIMMPGMDGYDVVRELKSDTDLKHVPVIFVTAMTEIGDEAFGFEVGAVDYITKPVSPAIVRARVKNHLNLVGADKLQETRLQIIQRLGHAAEYKDNETGMHVMRMSHYARLLGQAAGLSSDQVDLLFQAAPMHDVGKIGTPDRVLLKPGKLDADEWEIMKEHAVIGYKIIGEKHDEDAYLLRMAAEIAYTHHEKWNGSGYPRGLQGKEIPLFGRIVAIADVFDALTSARPYKPAWPIEKAVKLLEEEAGTHFDPELVPLFIDLLPQILEIRDRFQDLPES